MLTGKTVGLVGFGAIAKGQLYKASVAMWFILSLRRSAQRKSLCTTFDISFSR